MDPISAAKPLSQQSILRKSFAKVGEYIPKKIGDVFELNNKGNLGRYSLIFFSMIFVMGVRMYKARDAHERREALTRDASTILACMGGVPVLKNIMSTALDKATKIPTAANGKFFKKAISYDGLADWYSKADIMEQKVLTVAKNIDKNGGDVVKAFNLLGDNAKGCVNTILNGKDATSKNLLTALENIAEKTTNFTTGSGKLKQACDTLTDMLSNSKNELVKSAKRLKAVPDIVSLLLITLVLGWGIPAFNIKLTRKKVKSNENKPAQNHIEPAISAPQQTVIKEFFQKAALK
ncbi:MAG: hypothetical protein PHX18_07135 [Candidatus Gastranaerophilales bacterium]|nr:hypothetical protein [Candidatus Gastranaerophilales bacterium]